MTSSLNKGPIQIEELNLCKNNKLWFVQNNELDIVTLGFSFEGSGEIAEPKDLPGIATILAQVLNDCGVDQQDRTVFRKDLLAKNIDINVSSSTDRFLISVQTPKRHLSDAMEKLKLLLTCPKIDALLLDLSKQKCLAQLQQSLHEPEKIAAEKFKGYVFGESHVYAKTVASQIETTLKVTHQDVISFLNQALNSASINVAGNGNSDGVTLKLYLDDIINLLPHAVKPEHKMDSILLNQGITHKFNADVPQSIVNFCHPGISPSHPQFFEASLLLAALGSTPFESRLWQEVREKRGLTYGISISFTSSTLKSALLGSLATTPISVDKAIDIVKKEWEKTRENGITEEELLLQKQFLIDGYPMMFNTARGTIKTLLAYMAAGYTKDYPHIRYEKIQAVTLDEVNAFAKQFLKSELLTFVVYGKNG